MLKKSTDSISIYLTEEVLRVAQIKGSGANAQVVKLAVKDVTGIAEGDLPKTLQSLLKGFNSKSSEVFCIAPASTTTTKNIEVPSVSPEEIKSIVGLQAGRHTPFSREEIQVGYVNIGVYKTNYTKILLVIANKNTLKKQLDVCKKAGVSVTKVLFSPEGIAGVYSESLGLKEEPAPTGIIDVGEQSTDFVLTFKGLAITSRNIPIGKALLASEGAEAIDQLVEELSTTIESYQSEDIEQVPSNYLITVDNEYTQKLQAALTGKLKWMAEIVPYIDNIKATKDIVKKVNDKFQGISLLDVMAPALVASEAQVNLMPEELQLQKSVEDQGKEVFFATVCGLVLLVLMGCILGSRIYFHNIFLTKLKEEYKDNRQEVALLQKKSLRSRIVQNYLEERMISLDTLQELYLKVPDQVYLTGLFMDEDGNISIQGISDIASLVFNLGTDLKASELFKSVEIKSTTAKKDRGKDATSFEITLSLKNAQIEKSKNLQEKE
ncbi:hypothetical protein MNBD_UNCLBAC01-25 [hydrothermal vent metagenome]|uniref:Type IV pilus biogenesis protein PilM n=1 Tax=hydrothermal vent metagenome TaxID=652676 RepID=A0A3B1D3M8_9ZZZZ